MIGQGQLHHAAKLGQMFRNFNILSAGEGISAGMIMDQQDMYSMVFHRHKENLRGAIPGNS